MPCCILAAFLFGLVVRAIRRARGKDPEPVPTIPKPEVKVAPTATTPPVLRTETDAGEPPACREPETAAELQTVDA